MECKICHHAGHSAQSCHELYAPLYGEFGEGANTNGGGHDHDDESATATATIGMVPTRSPFPQVLEDTASNDSSMRTERQSVSYIRSTL